MAAPLPFDWTAHPSPDALAEALADRVAGALGEAIDARGSATLAVSGGTTPARFFAVLSDRELDWSRITVTLVDERFVPPDSPRSNERLVRDKLLQGKAAYARFISFTLPAVTHLADPPPPLVAPEETARAVSATLAKLPLPFDVVVLGMGTDGHTASFFPDADGLDALLDPAAEAIVLPVHAVSAGEPRLTLSLPAVASARMVALHIEGEAKRAAFEAAFDGRPEPAKPIRTVLEAAATRPIVYWAPSEGAKP